MGIDGISFPLVVLTSFVSMLAMGASWPINKHVKAYCILFLLLETGMLGVFLALDFFLFYVFWEVMLLPMYFLIGVWGGPRKEYAAIKFFLYTLFGSVLMLIAILMLYFNSDLQQADRRAIAGDAASSSPQLDDAAQQAGRSQRFSGARSPQHTFNILALQQMGQHTDHIQRRRCWWGTVAAVVGVPAAVHRLRHQGAERAVAHVVARCARRGPDADLDDPGRRALEDGRLRHHPHLLSDLSRRPATTWRMFVCGIGVVSMVYGAFAAMAQNDFKRLVAYSSVSHMGYVVLGIGVWSAAAGNNYNSDYWQMGMNGAMFQMIAHGISSAGMFFLVGVVYDRVHHRNLNEFGGLFASMPVYSGMAIGIFFAGLGLPGLCGFIGEVLVTLSVWNFSHTLAVISAAVGRSSPPATFCGPSSGFTWAPNTKARTASTCTPMTPRELAIAAPLLALAICVRRLSAGAVQLHDADDRSAGRQT